MKTAPSLAVVNELAMMGFGGIEESVRKNAACIITGEVESCPDASQEKSASVQGLVEAYRDIKQEEFLQNDFNRSSPDAKLKWLIKNVESPGINFGDIDFGYAVFGHDNFIIRALARAYRDQSPIVRDYARSRLEQLICSDKSALITRETLPRFIEELALLEEQPQPYAVVVETIKATATVIKSFLFNWGSNIYVLSYPKNGLTKYTLIDSGEKRYKATILKLFRDNGIEPANIERILLTHHHFDHSGLLDLLCLVSNARVLVHPDFRGESVELEPSRFSQYLEWLPPAREDRVRNIGSMPFSILGEPLDIGEGAKLEILGLPGGDLVTHTVDQLLFLYTPKNSPETLARIGADFRPTDEILFSGDLWLVQPPGFFEDKMKGLITADLIREKRRGFDFRPQNRKEKEALKAGFDLIRVKPGHGPEFLGSRLIGTLLARRDLLVKLGFDENGEKSVLDNPEFDRRKQELKENAYCTFINILTIWLQSRDRNGFGYSGKEAAGFLFRVYCEQTGGGEVVGEDRRERRTDLKNKLSRLAVDGQQPPDLRSVARNAIDLINKISGHALF